MRVGCKAVTHFSKVTINQLLQSYANIVTQIKYLQANKHNDNEQGNDTADCEGPKGQNVGQKDG